MDVTTVKTFWFCFGFMHRHRLIWPIKTGNENGARNRSICHHYSMSEFSIRLSFCFGAKISWPWARVRLGQQPAVGQEQQQQQQQQRGEREEEVDRGRREERVVSLFAPWPSSTKGLKKKKLEEEEEEEGEVIKGLKSLLQARGEGSGRN